MTKWKTIIRGPFQERPLLPLNSKIEEIVSRQTYTMSSVSLHHNDLRLGVRMCLGTEVAQPLKAAPPSRWLKSKKATTTKPMTTTLMSPIISLQDPIRITAVSYNIGLESRQISHFKGRTSSKTLSSCRKRRTRSWLITTTTRKWTLPNTKTRSPTPPKTSVCSKTTLHSNINSVSHSLNRRSREFRVFIKKRFWMWNSALHFLFGLFYEKIANWSSHSGMY